MNDQSPIEEKMTFLQQMRDFLRRNASVFLLGGLAVLLIQDIFGTHGVLAMRRAQKEAARVKQELQQMNNENRELQDNVRSLKSDPQTIERIAREEMGLARPGEYIFKIPEKKPADGSGQTAQPVNPQKTP
jgi:cell division protein FtsL